MAKQTSGKSEAQTSATTARPEVTSSEPDRAHAALGELVQRLARGPGSRGVRDAALALQRVAGNQTTARRLGARSGTRSVGEVARSGFQGASGRLPHAAKIQESFGAHDIRDVRSFTGPGAAAASHALSAEAYASGDRVVFADPAPSLHTAAHEAAHVVQQRAGIHLPGGMGSVGDVHERHADAVADAVVRGESAERCLDTYVSAGSRGGAAVVQRAFAKPLLDDVKTEKKDKTKIEERYATVIEKLVEAIKEDASLEFNADAVLAPILFRLERYEGDFTYSSYSQLIAALKTRGAILVDGVESGAYEAPWTKKYTLNLLLPGSGDSHWRTYAENMLGAPVATRKKQFANTKEIDKKDPKREKLGVESKRIGYQTFYEDLSASETEATYVIRGPNATNVASGKNDIATNIATGTAIATSFIEKYGVKGLKLRIMGHSRNGVAAARLTRDLRGENPGLEIDSVIFDPVPGGDANLVNSYSETTLHNDKENDKDVNSTVVYSLMDNRMGFNPMSVHGAKRLILTHYSHHAGMEHGFMFKEKHLKGLALLDLPEGVFLDEKQSPGQPNVLSGPYYNGNTIDKVLLSAKTLREDKNKNRIANIKVVVEAFLDGLLSNSHYNG